MLSQKVQPVNKRKWKKREYPRNQIVKAGKAIKRAGLGAVKTLAKEVEVVNNWRASHAFPMHVIYIHLRRMVKNCQDCTVAERLKRLESIITKLADGRSNSLWTMQDLGGCRLIVPSVKEVYQYSEDYEKSRKRHRLVEVYDYIKSPQKSGYRSLHMVYEYQSERSKDYNHNMLIEIQFRTHLQHLWATAVETMGLFTKKAIKSGKGSEDVKRFFALVSTLFAAREGQTTVPNTPTDIKIVVDEIRKLDLRKHYLDFLAGIKVATHFTGEKKVSKNGYRILKLDYSRRVLNVIDFKTFKEANDEYDMLESQKSSSKLDVVLVQVASFDALRAAYPNYFSDIEEFVKIVGDYLE